MKNYIKVIQLCIFMLAAGCQQVNGMNQPGYGQFGGTLYPTPGGAPTHNQPIQLFPQSLAQQVNPPIAPMLTVQPIQKHKAPVISLRGAASTTTSAQTTPTTITVTPIDPLILQNIQQYKNYLWATYQSADRTESGEFTNPNALDSMYTNAQEMARLASSQMMFTSNTSLRSACNDLVTLFGTVARYSTKSVANALNRITTVLNAIVKNNPAVYQNEFSSISGEPIISDEELIALPSSTAPAFIKPYRTVGRQISRAYDWTKKRLPLEALERGFGYAKSAAGTYASGAQAIWALAMANQEEIDKYIEITNNAKIELNIAKASGNAKEIRRLTKQIAENESYIGLLTGWAPYAVRALLLAGSVVAYKAGIIGAVLQGGYTLGSYGLSGAYNVGAAGVAAAGAGAKALYNWNPRGTTPTQNTTSSESFGGRNRYPK